MNLPLFIPIIWGAAIGAVAILGLGSYKLFSDDPSRNKLGLLGMQASGKTKFLCHLRNKAYIAKSTEIEPFNPFEYDNAGNKIYIDAGLDIGGGDLYRSEYNRIIKNSDVIFYFFDISKYLNDKNQGGIGYRRASNSRLEHIKSTAANMDIQIVIVGTHIDLYSKGKAKAKSKFLKLNENKSYFSILRNIELINLNDEKQLRNFTKKVFK
jgi:GTPase SAR1 family protein